MENRAIEHARRQSHNPSSLRPTTAELGQGGDVHHLRPHIPSPPPPATVQMIHQAASEEKQILNHLVQKIYEMSLKIEYLQKNIDSTEENLNQLSISLNENSNETRINQIHYNSEETLLVLRNIRGLLEPKPAPKRSTGTTAKLCSGGASLSPPVIKK
jgi:hypothetical protein